MYMKPEGRQFLALVQLPRGALSSSLSLYVCVCVCVYIYILSHLKNNCIILNAITIKTLQ